MARAGLRRQAHAAAVSGDCGTGDDPDLPLQHAAGRGLLARMAWLVLALLGGVALYSCPLISEKMRNVAAGEGWTAFEVSYTYAVIADQDTVLFLARDPRNRSTWTRIAPEDT